MFNAVLVHQLTADPRFQDGELVVAVVQAPALQAIEQGADGRPFEWVLPDFASLYDDWCAPAASDPDSESYHRPSPAEAAWLYSSAGFLADTTRDALDLDGPRQRQSCWLLPPCVPRYLARCSVGTAWAWQLQWMGSLRQIQAQLAVGRVPSPRCTADAMALYLTIDCAAGWAVAPEEERHRYDWEQVLARPAEPRWEWYEDAWFEDHDFLELFEEGEAARLVRYSEVLRPAGWFTPFE